MALKALSELVGLLCPTHSHELSITHPIPGDTLEGYSVMVECGEDDIVWAVQMWANCSFRRIRSSKRISIPSGKFADTYSAPQQYSVRSH